MKKSKIRLNRALSLKHEKEENILYIGVNPPRAVEITGLPKCLPDVLTYLNKPRDFWDVMDRFVLKHDYDPILSAKLLHDFEGFGVISNDSPMTRYDRHELFFGLYGINPDVYETVVSKLRVGLVGMGGIGSVCSMLLATAGVGELVIGDHDHIEETNLTRTLLYSEDDVGKLKVEVAARELAKKNSNCKIKAVARELKQDESEWLEQHFKNCDFIILSADTPFSIHHQINDFCLKHGIPNINVGYIEAVGAVGPLFVPGKTACFECEYQQTLAEDEAFLLPEINQHLQAPSYGPLNAYVSTVAINELLRYFFDLDPITLNKKLLFDFADYSVEKIEVKQAGDCACNGSAS